MVLPLESRNVKDLNVQSKEQDSRTGCKICSNGIMSLKFLDAPQSAGPSSSTTTCSESQPGMEKRKPRILVLCIFKVYFSSNFTYMHVRGDCSNIVILLKYLFTKEKHAYPLHHPSSLYSNAKCSPIAKTLARTCK